MSKIVYRYKIEENDANDNKMVAGVELSKQWKDFPSEKYELASFIKSVVNPNGFIDYEKKDLVSQEVIYRSVAKEREIPTYSKQALYLMSRNEIVEIFKMYGIDTTNKTKDFLIVELMRIQPKDEDVVEDSIKEDKANKPENTDIIIDDVIIPNKESALEKVFNKLRGTKTNE